jgi:16S rRNA (uracil1498-N3)-methyltransferase
MEGGRSISPAIIERMLPRFLVPVLAPAGSLVALPAAEGRHLARVRRLRVGDAVRVFDGRGLEFLARVEQAGKTSVAVRLMERVEPATEPPIRITVAQALLSGDKMDGVVRDLTMLGIAVLQPIVAVRSAVRSSVVQRAHRIERWRRIAVASAKQCGRAVVPEIDEPVRLQDWLCRDTSGIRLYLVEPAGDAPAGARGLPSAGPDRRQISAALLVGPEGGWTAGEATLVAGAGFVPWTLGTRTLRADAAAFVAVSILQFLWGDLG